MSNKTGTTMKRELKLLILGLPFMSLSLYAAEESQSSVTAEASSLASDYMARAEFFLEAEESDSAIYYYDKAIQADTLFHEAYYRKASLLFSNNRFQEALPANEKAIQCAPKIRRYMMLKGMILQSLNRSDEALAVLDEMERKFGSDAYNMLCRAYCYSDMGDVEKMRTACNKVIKMKGTTSYRFSAHRLLISHATGKEVSSLLKAMLKDMGGDNFRAQSYAVLCYNKIGAYDKAAVHQKKAIQLQEKQSQNQALLWVDEYMHGDSKVRVYEYFNPQDAGRMATQYIFRVYDPDASGARTLNYAIRVEYVDDVVDQYKSQMAVMSTFSKTGVKTYQTTLSDVKKMSYKDWKKFADDIMDAKQKEDASSKKRPSSSIFPQF